MSKLQLEDDGYERTKNSVNVVKGKALIGQQQYWWL